MTDDAPPRPAALLFDMVGTILDSDPIHAAVFVAFLADRGVPFAPADYMTRCHGRRNEEIFAELLPREDPWEMDRLKEAAFRERLARTGAAPTPGLLPLLDRAAAAGAPCALVTNACRANVDAVLAVLGLAGRFASVRLGEDCPRGKPDPEVYRRAIADLGVAPADCLAFEDSTSGLAAANAAGAGTVGVASGLTPAALRAAGAAHAIRDFADPALRPLLGF